MRLVRLKIHYSWGQQIGSFMTIPPFMPAWLFPITLAFQLLHNSFVITAMNEWKPKYWERNGWRKADGSAVVNRRDFEELDEAAGDMEVRYVSGQKLFESHLY